MIKYYSVVIVITLHYSGVIHKAPNSWKRLEVITCILKFPSFPMDSLNIKVFLRQIIVFSLEEGCWDRVGMIFV